MTTAILLVAHGSRLDSANRDLDWLAESLATRRPDDLVETAYLEIAKPDIKATYGIFGDNGDVLVEIAASFALTFRVDVGQRFVFGLQGDGYYDFGGGGFGCHVTSPSCSK